MKNNVIRDIIPTAAAKNAPILPASNQRPWLLPCLIVLCALVLRTAVAFHLPDRVLWSDGERYMKVADNLLRDEGFGSLRDNRFSVPTQPLAIAGIRLLFGDSLLALRLVFALVGTATCAVGYLLARRLFGRDTALLAAAGLAFYPHYLYISALFEYPQTLFIFTMSLAFLTYYQFSDTRRAAWLVACGLLLGVSILTVPTVMPLVPLLLGWLVLSQRGAWRVYAPVLLLLAVALPVGSWAYRNHLQYGEAILVNRGGGFALWTANNETYYELGKKAVTPPCGPGYLDTSFCRELRDIQQSVHGHGWDLDQRLIQTDKAQWASGMRFIQASYTRTLAFSVRKILQFWSPIPDAVSDDSAAGGSFGAWLAVVSYVPVLILGVLGLLLTSRSWRELVPVYAYFTVFTGAYAVFLPTTRYRLPLDFFLIVFSAAVLTLVLARRRSATP